MRCDALLLKSATLFLFAALSGCAPHDDLDLSPYARRELTAKEKDLLANTIKASLKDPASATFEFLPLPVAKGRVISYCLLVNSKNAFGGYVGLMPAEIAVREADNGEIVAATLAGISSGPLESGVDPWKWRCQTLGYLAT